MIKVNIFYPNKDGCRFDLQYYLNNHMPMAIEKLGPSLKGVSIEAFLAAFMPQAHILQGDISNYTDIEATIQYSEIKMSH
jgi:hypothetical protein